MERVRVENLWKKFGDVEAVRGINLSIIEGEFTVFLGPSGCGKTTTLRMIAGLEKPTSGEIFIAGRKVTTLPAARRNIAFVFQNYALYPHLTAFENIAFPLEAQRYSRSEIKERVEQVAQILGIEHLLFMRPHHLSSGDMQKIALGRAMVRRPQVFLMDEPLSGLDAKHREEMRAELKRLHMEIGATTIYVTHDQVEAMSMADKIVVMNEGIIQQVGSPREIYLWPENTFVAHFIGSPGMNFISLSYVDAKVGFQMENGQTFQNREMASLVEQQGGRDFILGIRPEFLFLDSQGEIQGRVVSVEPLGYKNLCAVEIASGKIVRVEDPEKRRPEGPVYLRVFWERACLFEAQSGKRLKWGKENG
ncbi:MAG: ABC transporter ATP-binding protein [Candidatus Caldatribacteriaceae bacterium]